MNMYNLAVYLLLNYLPMWIIIYMNRHLKINKERDAPAKFKPFLCYDYDQWSYVWTIFTHAFFWPRMIGAWAANFAGCLCSIIIMKTPNSKWRHKLFTMTAAFWVRMILLMFGVVWVYEVKVDENSKDQ